MVEENLDTDENQMPNDQRPDYLKQENLPNYLGEDLKANYISEPAIVS